MLNRNTNNKVSKSVRYAPVATDDNESVREARPPPKGSTHRSGTVSLQPAVRNNNNNDNLRFSDKPQVSQYQNMSLVESSPDGQAPMTPARSTARPALVPRETTVRTVCHCGRCSFVTLVRGPGSEPPEQVRCYCRGCRRFHSSAFGAFVVVPPGEPPDPNPPQDWTLGGKAIKQHDSCSALGAVHRVLCRHCYAKLATVPAAQEAGGNRVASQESQAFPGVAALLAMGSLDEVSVAEPLARHWRTAFTEWEADNGSAWWAAEQSRESGGNRQANKPTSFVVSRSSQTPLLLSSTMSNRAPPLKGQSQPWLPALTASDDAPTLCGCTRSTLFGVAGVALGMLLLLLLLIFLGSLVGPRQEREFPVHPITTTPARSQSHHGIQPIIATVTTTTATTTTTTTSTITATTLASPSAVVSHDVTQLRGGLLRPDRGAHPYSGTPHPSNSSVPAQVLQHVALSLTSSPTATTTTTTTITTTTAITTRTATTTTVSTTTWIWTSTTHTVSVTTTATATATTSSATTTTRSLSSTTSTTTVSGFSLSCHDARKGESCYDHVAWAMRDGIRNHPDWFADLRADAGFADVQYAVYRFNPQHCPKPCWRHGCHDARPGESCYRDVDWAMRVGIWDHPDWYPDLTDESRFEEFQQAVHERNVSSCPRPCKDVTGVRHYSGIPGASLDLQPANTPFHQRQELRFYVYRAQSEANYLLENVAAGDLAGVMWYLHNEVLSTQTPHRLHNITRLLRYKVTMKTTWAFYNVHRRQFGGFVAFDHGRCTVPNCNHMWKHFGFIVGCQFVNSDLAAYKSSIRTKVDCHCEAPDCCNSPVWYSFPGRCPGEVHGLKDPQCIKNMPGGHCQRVTGDRDCTYSFEEAGEVNLNELAGIADYDAFIKAGNREYLSHIDGGIGTQFWNGKRDALLCRRRVDQVKKLFDQRYPQMQACDDLPPPPCDFDAYLEDEFSWPAYDRPLIHGKAQA